MSDRRLSITPRVMKTPSVIARRVIIPLFALLTVLAGQFDLAPPVAAAGSAGTVERSASASRYLEGSHPLGMIPRHKPGQLAVRTTSASSNPTCTGCSPPLLQQSLAAPLLGGITGTPGHVTIVPYYWQPPGFSFTTNYKSIIDGYVANVAADSGKSTNVFSAGTQYYEGANTAANHLQYAIIAGSEIDDQTGFPVSGCTPGSGFSNCIDDTQLQGELTQHLHSLSLPVDDAHLYMVMFPQNVETCLGSACSTNSYCAYHSGVPVASNFLIYANEPFPDLGGCADPWNGAQAPNGDPEADALVSSFSHEANEALTDAFGAWYDTNGWEDGDECSYVYGAPDGGSLAAHTAYNQVINGKHYYTQDEFSNEDYALGQGDLTTTGGAGLPGAGVKVAGCVQQEGLVRDAVSTLQYSLANSDGVNWQDMDPSLLRIDYPVSGTASTVVLSANADLWTADAGYNQDIGIFVSDNGGADSLLAWKESGGFAGTFSPNAAYLQTVYQMQAGDTYTFKLKWKTNKPASGVTIRSGAGPISGNYSPTRLTGQVVPTPASTLSSNFGTSQYVLSNSDGATWVRMDAGTSDNLIATIPSAPANSIAVIGGNSDLWTMSAGYNQDIAIFVSDNGGTDQLVSWKESGGFAGTFSPNAAFVQGTWPLTAGHSYVFKLYWKTNKPASGVTIRAGAGPINSAYSPTRITAQVVPSTNLASLATSNEQYTLSNSDGSTWQLLDAANEVQATLIPASNTTVVVGGNADLWTVNAGYNQDLGVFVSDNGGADQLLAWKESGGFAGTFSPNAAFVQVPYNVIAGHTYLFKLKWKTNRSASGVTIHIGAGPIDGAYSPTRITVQMPS